MHTTVHLNNSVFSSLVSYQITMLNINNLLSAVGKLWVLSLIEILGCSMNWQSLQNPSPLIQFPKKINWDFVSLLLNKSEQREISWRVETKTWRINSVLKFLGCIVFKKNIGIDRQLWINMKYSEASLLVISMIP